MRNVFSRRAPALFAVALAAIAAASIVGAAGQDPLAAEIDRWSTFLATNPRSDENWTQIKKVTEPLITRARQALSDGQRLLALYRLAAARTNLAAAAWVDDGRYTPLKSAASHERFRADLSRTISLVLAGKKERARGPVASGPDEISAMPAVTLTDLEGKTVTRDSLAGKAVLVEFWATWCPPCRGTLAWLGDLKKRYGDRLAVVAVAVESDEAAVRKVAADTKLPLIWAMGNPDVARSFGDISAVPTLFLFDRSGSTAAAFYGAPPTLHGDAEGKLATLLR